jgi:hypothetical protein
MITMCHCEERSDVAIQTLSESSTADAARWIATAFGLAMTVRKASE